MILQKFAYGLMLCPLLGCSQLQAPQQAQEHSEFDKKVTCAEAAGRAIKGRDESVYISESFYSPKRNSCVAVIVTIKRPNIDYEILDTLTYETVLAQGATGASERTAAQAAIDEKADELKRR